MPRLKVEKLVMTHSSTGDLNPLVSGASQGVDVGGRHDVLHHEVSVQPIEFNVTGADHGDPSYCLRWSRSPHNVLVAPTNGPFPKAPGAIPHDLIVTPGPTYLQNPRLTLKGQSRVGRPLEATETTKRTRVIVTVDPMRACAECDATSFIVAISPRSQSRLPSTSKTASPRRRPVWSA
jgi:hypothetical protein